ncbi:MAG: hypothetical protein HY074_00610 [Deltaproteobacteria bacterium]|nr:hypothetical protein [Deltaproteobacteria bacterium]
MTRFLTFRIAITVALTTSQLAFADSWGEKRPDFNPKFSKNHKKAKPIPAGSPLEVNDILLGIKGGVQFNSYTGVNVDGASHEVSNGTGYLVGGAFYWNVGLPRLEFDVLVNTRKSGYRDTVPYIGFPALVKFNISQNKMMTWEAGTGIQTDVAIGGGSTRRGVLLGLPVATDLLVDFADIGVHVCFELRYIFGMTTYDTNTTGGRPRDFDMMIGLMLPIDRDGF